MTMLSWIGWLATAVFACSYFGGKPAHLRMIQAAAAVMWVVYGFLIHAMPVVVANAIVAVAAVYSSVRTDSRAVADSAEGSSAAAICSFARSNTCHLL